MVQVSSGKASPVPAQGSSNTLLALSSTVTSIAMRCERRFAFGLLT